MSGMALTQLCVGAGQQLFELIQTGRFPLGHGRGAGRVLVGHAGHKRYDGRPVGQGPLPVEAGMLPSCIWWYEGGREETGYTGRHSQAGSDHFLTTY